MTAFAQDLRSALRSLRRSPAFTAGALATLTIAIAANTTMLSVLQEVLVRALPYEQADRLFMMVEGDGKGAYRAASYQTFLDWQRQSRTLSGLAFVRGNNALLRMPSGPERVVWGAVTPGFFATAGFRPIIGRAFDQGEEAGTGGDVAVISYELWRGTFGGDRGIVGRTIDYDSASIRVVGIAPAGASGFFPYIQVWRPLTGRLATDPALANRNFHVDSRAIGRLRPGATLDEAKAEFRVIQRRLASAHPEESGGWVEGAFFSMREIIVGDVSSTLLLLGAGVFVVLLIACVNVSNLSLVRAIARERELAVRRALGATTARLARGLLAESALIGATAGGAGLLLAAWAIRALRAGAGTGPGAGLPRATELTVDARVAGVAVALALLVTALIGAASVLRLRARGFADPLRGAQRHGASARMVQLKNVLSVVQLALAVTLLLGGGLLLRSVQRIQRVDLGYDPDHVVTFLLFPPAPTYERPEDAAALYQRTLDAVGALPGVESAAVINRAPPGPFVTTRIVVPGRGAETQSADVASYRTVSAGYLRTLRLSLLHGRWFTDADMHSPGDGIVVSESVAKRYWPGRDPTGEPLTIFGASQRRADYGQPQPSRVIGVVADLRSFGDKAPEPTADVYVPFTRETWPAINVLVRVRGDPGAFIPALKRAVLAVDPAIPVSGSLAAGGPAPMGRGLTQALATRQYVMRLLGGFAASAFVLALVGVYGVIAYGVTQRRHELGVRLALGATPADVFAMIVRTGLGLAAMGVGLGVGAGLGLTRLMTSLLYETSPTEPGTFVGVSLAVGVTVLLASAIPARRAARVDPLESLRSE